MGGGEQRRSVGTPSKMQTSVGGDDASANGDEITECDMSSEFRGVVVSCRQPLA